MTSEEAEAFFRELESRAREHLGDQDVYTVTVRAHLGSCLVAAGKLDEGERLLLETLPLLPLVDMGVEVEAALRSLVDLYTVRGNQEKVEEYGEMLRVEQDAVASDAAGPSKDDEQDE